MMNNAMIDHRLALYPGIEFSIGCFFKSRLRLFDSKLHAYAKAQKLVP